MSLHCDQTDVPINSTTGLNIDDIVDQDTLRRLWEKTRDLTEKKRIRARMYQLRENRLSSSGEIVDVDVQVDSLTSNQVDSKTIDPSETKTSKSPSPLEQKRRSSTDKNVVSEKIRKTSTERTKRYEKILSEMDGQTSIKESGQEISTLILDFNPSREPIRAEELGFAAADVHEGSRSETNDGNPSRSVGTSTGKNLISTRKKSTEFKAERRFSTERRISNPTETKLKNVKVNQVQEREKLKRTPSSSPARVSKKLQAEDSPRNPISKSSDASPKKDGWKSGHSQSVSPLASPSSPRSSIPIRSATSLQGSSVPKKTTAPPKSAAKPEKRNAASRSEMELDVVSRSPRSKIDTKPLAAALGIPGMFIRTVEITRTVTVRDDDKPWRINSKKTTETGKSAEKPTVKPERLSKKPPSDLHGNVLRIVQKYLDTEGCAIHGCKHSHEPEDDEPPEKPSKSRQSISVRSRKAERETQLKTTTKTSTKSKPVTETKDTFSKAKETETETETLKENSTIFPDSTEENIPESLEKPEPTTPENDLNSEEMFQTKVATPERVIFDKEKSQSPIRDSSKEKLSATSALGSPSVVMKARSLLHSPNRNEEKVNIPENAEPEKPERKPSLKSAESNRRKISDSNKDRRFSKEENNGGASSGRFIADETFKMADVSNPLKEQQRATSARKSPERTTKRQSKSSLVEDIDDLGLLENMLNSATGYDERSKIRAQIRSVRRKIAASETSSHQVSRTNTVTDVDGTVKSTEADEPNIREATRRKNSAGQMKNADKNTRENDKIQSLPPRKSPEKELRKSPEKDARKPEEIRRKSPEKDMQKSPERDVRKSPEKDVRKSPEKDVRKSEEIAWRKTSKEEVSPAMVDRRKSSEKTEVTAPIFRPVEDLKEVAQSSPALDNQVPWRRQSSSQSLTLRTSRVIHLQGSPGEVPNTQDPSGSGPRISQDHFKNQEMTPCSHEGTLLTQQDLNTKEEEMDKIPGDYHLIHDRSQPLRDIIRRHESEISADSGSGSTTTTKPKARLRDSFIRHFDDETITELSHKKDDSILTQNKSEIPGDRKKSQDSFHQKQHISTGSLEPKDPNNRQDFSLGLESSPRLKKDSLKESSPERKTSQSDKSSGQLGRQASSVTLYLELNNSTNTPSAENDKLAPTEDDPTPWRRKSIPREPSLPPSESKTPPTLTRSPMVPSSVRSLAQKFQSPNEDTNNKTSKQGFSKTGSVFRSTSFKHNGSIGESPRSGSVERSESFHVKSNGIDHSSDEKFTSKDQMGSIVSSVSRRTSVERRTSTTWTSRQQSSREQSPEKSSTTTTLTMKTGEDNVSKARPKSFLEDRTPVKGMQDIMERMRATETLDINGRPSKDDEARCLLNKFLGAQILVQCTEPLVRSHTPDLVATVDSSKARTQDDKNTKLQDDQGEPWTHATTTTGAASSTLANPSEKKSNIAMADPVIVNGVDINTCEDDFQLNELLDSCNDYETRRKIRSRIKAILSDPKRQNEVAKNIGNMGRVAVTRTEVITRSSFSSTSVRPNQPISAFAKFQQLDKNVKPSPR